MIARNHHYLHAGAAQIVHGGFRFGAKFVAKHGKRKKRGFFRQDSFGGTRKFALVTGKSDHASAAARLFVQAFFHQRRIQRKIAFAVETVRDMRQQDFGRALKIHRCFAAALHRGESVFVFRAEFLPRYNFRLVQAGAAQIRFRRKGGFKSPVRGVAAALCRRFAAVEIRARGDFFRKERGQTVGGGAIRPCPLKRGRRTACRG